MYRLTESESEAVVEGSLVCLQEIAFVSCSVPAEGHVQMTGGSFALPRGHLEPHMQGEVDLGHY